MPKSSHRVKPKVLSLIRPEEDAEGPEYEAVITERLRP